MAPNITGAGLTVFNGYGTAQYMLDLRLEIEYTDFLTGTDIHYFSLCLWTFIETDYGSYSVRDINIIARLLPVTKHRKCAAIKCALQQCRNNASVLPIVLSWAIVIKRAHHPGIEAKGGGIGTHQVIAGRFTRRIGSKRVKPLV